MGVCVCAFVEFVCSVHPRRCTTNFYYIRFAFFGFDVQTSFRVRCERCSGIVRARIWSHGIFAGSTSSHRGMQSKRAHVLVADAEQLKHKSCLMFSFFFGFTFASLGRPHWSSLLGFSHVKNNIEICRFASFEATKEMSGVKRVWRASARSLRCSW